MTPDQWAAVRHLVDRFDARNGTGEHETAVRLLKLTEEAGEAAQAYIGVLGHNARKGVTHTAAEVADELCDVIVSAAIALHAFSDDPSAALDDRLRRVTARLLPHLREAEAEAEGKAEPAPEAEAEAEAAEAGP